MRRTLGIVLVVAVLTATAVVVAVRSPPAGAAVANRPVVAMASTPTGRGYWLVSDDGGVFAFGDAGFHGSTGAVRLNQPIVGMAPTPSGGGYWLVASDGGIFAFGDARFHGSTGAIRLNQPVVGMAATPSGGGYWLVARDGGIFAFGDAPFRGSTGAIALNQPVVGMAATPSGDGYWLVARDGGIFAFGGARFHGSTGAIRLNQPIVGMAATPGGGGYWLAAADGGIFAFGDAGYHGGRAGLPLAAPVVELDRTPSGAGYWLATADGSVYAFGDAAIDGSLGAPALSVGTVVGGLTIPWDVAFTPDATMLLTERGGRFSAVVDGMRRTLAQPSTTFVSGEGGMMGLAVDPDFAVNRLVRICTAYESGGVKDVRVQTWLVDLAYTSAALVDDGLVTGIPLTSGRHSGCRLLNGPDGHLWIGTGDAATGTNPQNLGSLGGKVLRVDRFTGEAAPGNLQGLVYSYGHRNVQGLALRPGGDVFSVEHGPDRDDEVNLLRAGNYGWNPVPGSYNESVPMTDLAEFPDAIPAVWSSGAPPAIAPSGATFLEGQQWQGWNGQLVVATLRGQHLRLLFLDAAGKAVGDHRFLTGHGRLRDVTLGPDGALYVTTSNGGGADVVLRVAPT